MADAGRIAALIIASPAGAVVHERFHVRLTALERADLRSARAANAAGCVNWGFPTIADTDIPEILPTGVCTYEHVVANVDYDEMVAKSIEIRGLKVTVAKIDIPLATGERDRTIYEVLPYLQERCIDILQPDCSHTGGISQMRKIATLAEAYYVPLAPHCTGSFLGIAARLHVTVAIPLFLIHEFYPEDARLNPPGILRMEYAYDDEGHIGLPPGPGLGVEVDEKLLAAEAAKPQTWKWPGQKLKDGSVADY